MPKVIGLAEALSEWLDAPPRRAGAPLEASAGADRASARSARRLPDRLSQPRQGDQDHPQRGRAEARPDEDVQAHRRAGRRHPQHAAAQPAQARGDGDPPGGQGPARGEEIARGAARAPRRSSGRRSPTRSRRCATTFGPKTPLGKRRTSFAEAPEHDEAAIEEAMVEREPITVVVSEKGWIRALHGHVADLSGIAFKTDDGLKFAFSGRDHVEDPGVRHQRPLLHARRRRSCPAAAATASRSGCSSTWSRKPTSSRCSAIRAAASSWSRAEQGSGFVVPEDECLANTRKGKQVLNVKPPDAGARRRAGRGRPGRRDRREPQDGDLPARPGAGDDARPRRAAAALQGRRAVRRHDLQGRRRPDLGRRAGRSFNQSLKELAAWRGNRGDAGRVQAGPFPHQPEIRPPRENGKDNGKETTSTRTSRSGLSQPRSGARVRPKPTERAMPGTALTRRTLLTADGGHAARRDRQKRKPPGRAGRCGSWCRIRRPAAPTPRRASSTHNSARISVSPSPSKIAAAPAAPSPRPWSPRPIPTATPSCTTPPRSR